MTRLAVLAAALILIAYLFNWITMGRFSPPKEPSTAKHKKRKKIKPGEMWNQVFETASRDEAGAIQMRLEEEDIDVTVFEQAKKNLSGETPPGYGLVVPREQSTYAQQLIFRYLEHRDNDKDPTE